MDPALSQPPLEILYEEGPVLAVLKPGGVLTQAPPGIDSMENRVKSFLKERDGKLGRVYLGIVHRLDRPVSGVMLFAKHARAARRLAEQFEGRLIDKTYWAFVEGAPAEEAGTWTDYLRKIPDEPRVEVVGAEHPEGRLAVLHYRTRDGRPEGTWLEITLETGRTHQIRVQAASRGHFVFGDSQYGSTRPFGPQTDDERARWIALHARRVAFSHPMTREMVEVTAPLPEPWQILTNNIDAITGYNHWQVRGSRPLGCYNGPGWLGL